MKKFLKKAAVFLTIGLFIFSCSNGDSDNTVYEGYAFSYKQNTLYITWNNAYEFTYRVIDGEGKDKEGFYQLDKIHKYKQIYEYKEGSTLVRVAKVGKDLRKNEDNHIVVFYIKDGNFPDGMFGVGMLEEQKKRVIPQIIYWPDGIYSNMSLTTGNEKTDYRIFTIRNFASYWYDENAQIIPDIFEPDMEGKLKHKENVPYTYEYRFDGYYFDTNEKLIDLLADGTLLIAKIKGDEEKDIVPDIEVGTKSKNIQFSEFPEGQKVWIICSNGKWAEGEIDDFDPEPLEDIERPNIAFTFNDNTQYKIYATFGNNLCSTLVNGSYACDFMYPYILDPRAQIIVLNDIFLGTEEGSIDCIGGW